jgi:hypothetical protein
MIRFTDQGFRLGEAEAKNHLTEGISEGFDVYVGRLSAQCWPV